MDTENIIKPIRLIGSLFLGICYVKMTTIFLNEFVKAFGNMLTDFSKISTVSSSAALSTLIVFLFNHFLIKAPEKHVAYFSSISTFSYFYIVKAHEGTLVLLIGVFQYLYSSVAFFVLVFSLIVAYLILKRITRRSSVPTNKQVGP